MRRRKKDIDMNLDSLLDTMTNVVGILVILLAVTQLGVGEAIKQVVGGGETAEVTYEEVDEETKKLEELQIKLNELKEQYDLDKINLEQMQRDINKYRQILTEFDKLSPSIKSTDFSNLEDEVKRLRERLGELNKEIARLDKDVREKESRIAQKYPEGPKILDVNVPVLTPVSEVSRGQERLEPVCFICRNGRIYPFDRSGILNRANEELKKIQKSKTATLQNIQTYFREKDCGNQYFSLIVTNERNLMVMPRPNQGETIQQLKEPNSTYMSELKALHPKGHIVEFHVWSDSFDVYVAAREISQKVKKNLHGNWIPYPWNREFLFYYGSGTGGSTKPKILW